MVDEVIPMSAFARFYEAPGTKKVSIVRDTRTMLADQDGYAARDYYRELRNELRRTHWSTNRIEELRVALGPLTNRQRDPNKRDHFLQLGQAYIRFWEKEKASFFKVPNFRIDIAGLTISVSTEVGLSTPSKDQALRLWFGAKKPTVRYRQAIEFMTRAGRSQVWEPEWVAGLWDIRRHDVLPPPRMPRDFVVDIDGQSAAFQQIWGRLGVRADDF